MLSSLKGSPPATDLCCLSADFGRGGEDDAGFDDGGGFLTSPLMFLVLFLRGGALSLPECAPLPLLLRRRWLLLTMRSSVRRSSRLDCDLLLCLRSSAGFRSLLQFFGGFVAFGTAPNTFVPQSTHLLASADRCRLLYRWGWPRVLCRRYRPLAATLLILFKGVTRFDMKIAFKRFMSLTLTET